MPWFLTRSKNIRANVCANIRTNIRANARANILANIRTKWPQRHVSVATQRHLCGDTHTKLLSKIFSRTDLRKGVSKSKFDAQLDFVFHLFISLLNNIKNLQTTENICTQIPKQINQRVEKWNVGNRLKRVLWKFEANGSYSWGVEDRLKFGVRPYRAGNGRSFDSNNMDLPLGTLGR